MQERGAKSIFSCGDTHTSVGFVTRSRHYNISPLLSAATAGIWIRNMSNGTTLHVRAETKPLEHRSAITPSIAKKLVDAGYTVNVERAPLSIFKDTEYDSTGATLVPTGSWTEAPDEHIIVGLKELPEEDFPLKHTVRTMSEERS